MWAATMVATFAVTPSHLAVAARLPPVQERHSGTDTDGEAIINLQLADKLNSFFAKPFRHALAHARNSCSPSPLRCRGLPGHGALPGRMVTAAWTESLSELRTANFGMRPRSCRNSRTNWSNSASLISGSSSAWYRSLWETHERA